MTEMPNMRDPTEGYRDDCGCVWRHGRRVHVCSEHRHKDGIRPYTGSGTLTGKLP